LSLAPVIHFIMLLLYRIDASVVAGSDESHPRGVGLSGPCCSDRPLRFLPD